MVSCAINTVEKSSHTLQLIEELQTERWAVWSLYCKIAEMKPYADSETLRPVLSKFSQLLIDYVSLGHFGVYEHLFSAEQEAQAALDYAQRIYPVFTHTTASAVNFSDGYDGRHRFRIENLTQDLSVLGEHLAQRMELEDRLCSMLLH